MVALALAVYLLGGILGLSSDVFLAYDELCVNAVLRVVDVSRVYILVCDGSLNLFAELYDDPNPTVIADVCFGLELRLLRPGLGGIFVEGLLASFTIVMRLSL